MDCPRCGQAAVTTPECPRCGVLLAKARPSRARPQAPPPAQRRSAWRALLLPGLGLALVVAAAVHTLRSTPTPASTTSARPAEDEPTPPPVSSAPFEPAALDLSPPSPPPPESLRLEAKAIEADRASAARLADKLRRRAPIGTADLEAAEGLFDRHAAPARPLVEAVLLAAAVQEQQRRQPQRALAHLRRAVAVAPDSANTRRLMLALLLETGDWAGAEVAAQALLALDPTDAAGQRGLAFALVRQDRNREALENVTAALEAREDPQLRALRERLSRDLASEKGMSEQRLSHFHVRYDGEAHEDVGREILRVLDRHYATLVRTFDHQPRQPIPVILFSTQGYYDATGAPAWSGGHYDTHDGRVRIPIGGLTPSLTPDLDEALLHELTHAFITDRSRGVAPRQIQEGLAQYMEGKRIGSLLPADGLRALADGRIAGVAGFYYGSLAFVEHLITQRGQGGINDLLAAMSETASVDEAFRRVYGSDFATALSNWAARLRQDHGS